MAFNGFLEFFQKGKVIQISYSTGIANSKNSDAVIVCINNKYLNLSNFRRSDQKRNLLMVP